MWFIVYFELESLAKHGADGKKEAERERIGEGKRRKNKEEIEGRERIVGGRISKQC